MLACPNAADTEIFKCYSYGWAVMKGQSKFCCVFAFFLQSDYLQEGHYLFSFSSIYTIDVIAILNSYWTRSNPLCKILQNIGRAGKDTYWTRRQP